MNSVAELRGFVGSWALARDARAQRALGARRRLIGKLLLLTSLLGLGLALFVGRSELQHRALRESVDAHVGTYQRQRWPRPVLRGPSVEGNAAADAQKALQGFKRLADDKRDSLAAAVYYGRPLSDEQAASIDEQAYRIAQLRAATQRSFAMTTLDPEKPLEPPPPDYVRVVDAALIALADAGRQPPDACLPAALDTVRLGQDLVPGAPLEAASVAARITSLAARVIGRCVRGASYSALLSAARELRVLAANPPPSFGGLELADLQALVLLRDLGSVWPPPQGDNPLRRLRQRPVLLEASQHFSEPARWRAVRPADYPQALSSWLDEQEWRDRAELPLVRTATGDATGFLFDDMRCQALLRVLTVGLATLAERESRKRMPREPVGLQDPALRDPFNGRPLLWRIAEDASELSVWSVGEDRRDDKGSSQWAQQAPLDVVVHFDARAAAATSANKATVKRGVR